MAGDGALTQSGYLAARSLPCTTHRPSGSVAQVQSSAPKSRVWRRRSRVRQSLHSQCGQMHVSYPSLASRNLRRHSWAPWCSCSHRLQVGILEPLHFRDLLQVALDRFDVGGVCSWIRDALQLRAVRRFQFCAPRCRHLRVDAVEALECDGDPPHRGLARLLSEAGHFDDQRVEPVFRSARRDKLGAAFDVWPMSVVPAEAFGVDVHGLGEKLEQVAGLVFGFGGKDSIE